MATIKLSKTGNQYQLAVNGWAKTKDKISLVVIATDEPTETAQEVFSGNEQIEMRDASIRITAEGYVYCESVERIEDYPAGGMDKHGDDVLADVWKIVVSDVEHVEIPFAEEPTEEVDAPTEEIDAPTDAVEETPEEEPAEEENAE